MAFALVVWPPAGDSTVRLRAAHRHAHVSEPSRGAMAQPKSGGSRSTSPVASPSEPAGSPPSTVVLPEASATASDGAASSTADVNPVAAQFMKHMQRAADTEVRTPEHPSPPCLLLPLDPPAAAAVC